MATINIQVQCPVLRIRWIWLLFESQNTVLMMSPSLFSLTFRKKLHEEEMRELENTVKMASLDIEMKK